MKIENQRDSIIISNSELLGLELEAISFQNLCSFYQSHAVCSMDLFLTLKGNFMYPFLWPPPLFLTRPDTPTPIIFQSHQNLPSLCCPSSLAVLSPLITQLRSMCIITPLHTSSIPSPSYFIFRDACKFTTQLNPILHLPHPCIYAARSGGEKDNQSNWSHFQASSGPFMSLGLSHHTSWFHFTFFPFSLTLSHLLSHPHSQLMLLPISLKEWKRISIRNLPPHIPARHQHLQQHPLPSTMLHLTHLLLPTGCFVLTMPSPLSYSTNFSQVNMSKTELLISHCMFLYLQPFVSQWKATPSFQSLGSKTLRSAMASVA